jgi:hypothetical protein
MSLSSSHGKNPASLKKISGTNKKSPKKTPKEEMLTQEITPAKNIYTANFERKRGIKN